MDGQAEEEIVREIEMGMSNFDRAKTSQVCCEQGGLTSDKLKSSLRGITV